MANHRFPHIEVKGMNRTDGKKCQREWGRKEDHKTLIKKLDWKARRLLLKSRKNSLKNINNIYTVKHIEDEQKM